MGTGSAATRAARLDEVTARRRELFGKPGRLRPGAAANQPADRPHPEPQPLPPHRLRT